MICPCCERDQNFVRKNIDGKYETTNRRLRQCDKCGFKFATTERVDKIPQRIIDEYREKHNVKVR